MTRWGLIETLDEDLQQNVIEKLSSKTRVALEEGLSFPEDSAGRLMRRELVAIPEFWNVGKTIGLFARGGPTLCRDEFFDVFIIDPSHHLAGTISLGTLIRSKRSDKIKDLSVDVKQPISAEMDQEEVAHIFRRDDIISAPVVD